MKPGSSLLFFPGAARMEFVFVDGMTKAEHYAKLQERPSRDVCLFMTEAD
jgi:hypothetical protein